MASDGSDPLEIVREAARKLGCDGPAHCNCSDHDTIRSAVVSVLEQERRMLCSYQGEPCNPNGDIECYPCNTLNATIKRLREEGMPTDDEMKGDPRYDGVGPFHFSRTGSESDARDDAPAPLAARLEEWEKYNRDNACEYPLRELHAIAREAVKMHDFYERQYKRAIADSLSNLRERDEARAEVARLNTAIKLLRTERDELKYAHSRELDRIGQETNLLRTELALLRKANAKRTS
jgi:hypothetical protein